MARITVKGRPGPQLRSRPEGERELRAHGREITGNKTDRTLVRSKGIKRRFALW